MGFKGGQLSKTLYLQTFLLEKAERRQKWYITRASSLKVRNGAAEEAMCFRAVEKVNNQRCARGHARQEHDKTKNATSLGLDFVDGRKLPYYFNKALYNSYVKEFLCYSYIILMFFRKSQNLKYQLLRQRSEPFINKIQVKW